MERALVNAGYKDVLALINKEGSLFDPKADAEQQLYDEGPVG